MTHRSSEKQNKIMEPFSRDKKDVTGSPRVVFVEEKDFRRVCNARKKEKI